MAFKAGAIYGEAILDTKNWDSGIKKIGKSSLNVAKVAAVAFVGAMTVSIVKANEFQKSMSNVSTVIDTSAISTQDMTKSLLALDPALGKTTELTDGLYQSFSAGADTMEEALQTTVDAAKFSKAALTDTATAVDVLTTASNAYGKDIVSTTQASDIFFTTIKQGKITGEQLAATIGQSIPVFASTGIELEQLSSGMAAMTKQGISAAEATTQMNAIINSMLKPTEAMSEAMKEYGFESGSAFLESEGLTGVLQLLEDQTGGNADKISELIPNIRAMKGAMALTGVGGEEYTAILKEMETAAGATDIAFDKQEKTFETLANQMDKVAIVSGNIGKHFVDEIAAGATEAAGAMLTFLTSSSGMEVVGNIVGGVAASFEFLKSFIDPIVQETLPALEEIFTATAGTLDSFGIGLNEGSGAFNLFAGVSQFAASTIKIFSTGLSNGIELLGAYVDAIKATGGTISTFFDFITGDAEWADVKAQADLAGDSFKTAGKTLIDSWVDLGSTVKDEVLGFGDVVKQSSLEMETNIVTSFNNQKNSVTNSWGEMITGQSKFVDDMLANSDKLADGLEDGNEEVVESNVSTRDKLKAMWSEHWGDSKAGWADMYDSIVSGAGSVMGDLSGITSQIFTNEQAELDNKIAAEEDALTTRLETGLITQEEYDVQSEALAAQALEKQNALKKRQFDAEKALNISSVWVNAAGSIMGWWNSAAALGPIAGPIFAGIMTGATLATAGVQTGLIASQQFVPAREMGGMASGMTRVNEAGGEIISLPDGSQVIPNDISQKIAGSVGQGGGNVININNPVIRNDQDIEKLARQISRILSKDTRRAG